jgi:osmotically-inducible protein OsmY
MISRQESNVYEALRPDKSIKADIWTALAKKQIIRAFDLNSISITVEDGVVLLEGHVARDQNRQLIADISHSVSGVIAIQNSIISDRDLNIEVAKSLAKDEHTRPYLLYVGSWHGWVRISGEVPTNEVQLAVEAAASRVPPVRGVISLPSVEGKSQESTRSTLQPEIGANVYGDFGLVGEVIEVIINPRSRLVGQIVVSANYEVDGWPVFGEYILPVDSLGLVNYGSIFLARESKPLSTYPVFDPTEYPMAPYSWQPPYPYPIGSVRWSREDLVETYLEPERWPEVSLYQSHLLST